MLLYAWSRTELNALSDEIAERLAHLVRQALQKRLSLDSPYMQKEGRHRGNKSKLGEVTVEVVWKPGCIADGYGRLVV